MPTVIFVRVNLGHIAAAKAEVRGLAPIQDVMKLTENDFYLPRFRYVAPRPYTREEYEHLQRLVADSGAYESRVAKDEAERAVPKVDLGG